MTDRSDYPTRKRRLGEDADDLAGTDAAARLAMVWPLTLQAWAALAAFGAPLHELTPDDLVADDLVFQIGVAPSRIDLLTTIGGVTFADAWPRRGTVDLWGLRVPVIGRDDLILSKKAAGRPRDLADLAELEGTG
jgi:hypothetical protein